jgi:hypothetical protein
MKGERKEGRKGGKRGGKGREEGREGGEGGGGGGGGRGSLERGTSISKYRPSLALLPYSLSFLSRFFFSSLALFPHSLVTLWHARSALAALRTRTPGLLHPRRMPSPRIPPRHWRCARACSAHISPPALLSYNPTTLPHATSTHAAAAAAAAGGAP